MTELKYTEMRLTFGWANKRLLLIGVVAVIFVIFLGYFITSLSSVTPDEEVSSVLDTEKTSKSEEKDPEPPVEKSEAETTTEITEVKTTKEMAQMAVETKTVPSGATGLLFKGEIVRQFPSKDRKFLTYKPKKLHREQSNLCEKFGVVTTIFNMSTAVKRFLQMSDWCLVVVGDKKEPKNYFGQIQHFSSSRVYHLTAQLQLKMGWDLADLLPWNDVARKNVGYAYAISLGAKYIWDFDDDNQLNFFLPQSAPLGGPSLDNFVNSAKLSSNASLSVVEITNVKCLAFNIFDHILNESDKNYWPRGYPLDLINNRTCSQGEREKVKLQSDQLAAVQSLADKELDYDAIFRLTRKFKFWLNLRGENQLLIIPKTTFVPYNGQSILQLYPGFWSLYLPFTVNGRVSDIWRSYAAQRLFREANLRWGYFSRPIVVQDRNSHRYLADFQAETDLYKKSGKFLEFLDSWNSTASSLPAMIEQLWIDMYERDYVGLKDVLAIQKWLELLSQIGYQFPKVSQTSENTNDQDDSSNSEPDKLLSHDFGLVTLNSESIELESDETCGNLQVRNFWTSDIHDGTRVEIPSVLNHLGHNVTIAGHLGSTGFYPDVWQHPGIFIHKNISRVIDNYKLAGAELSEKQIEENFNFFKSQSEIAQTDAFVCSFPASMCELWAPFNKTIIFATSHRYNLGRCRLSAWNNLDSLLQIMAKSESPKHFVASVSQYDMEYLSHYTDLKPVFLEAFSGFYTNVTNYNPTNEIFLILGQLKGVESVKTHKISDLEEIYPKYQLNQLASHPAIIYMPYSVMSFKLTEFYAMGIPLFMPSLKYFHTHEFGIDRSALSSMYCKKNLSHTDSLKLSHPNSAHPYSPNTEEKEAQLYWLQFSDFYQLPYITHFDSLEDLELKLSSVNLTEIHSKMMSLNKLRLNRLVKTWCQVIKQIDIGRKVPENYQSAIEQLFGLSRISVL